MDVRGMGEGSEEAYGFQGEAYTDDIHPKNAFIGPESTLYLEVAQEGFELPRYRALKNRF